MAEEKKKFIVSLFWKNLLNIFYPQKFSFKKKSFKTKFYQREDKGARSPSQTNEIKSMIKSEDDQMLWNQMTPNSMMSQQKFGELKTPDSTTHNPPKVEKGESVEGEIDLETLYEYFEKFGEKFQQELELKNIMIEDEMILIKKNCVNDYNKSMINNMNIEEKKQEEVSNQINQMTNMTLLNTLQSLIDDGELLHAFQIYLAIRGKVNIPENQVRLWTHSYIELLRTHNLHKLANECVKNSNIIEIKNTNKVLEKFS